MMKAKDYFQNKKKYNKYKNKETLIDGITFDSKKESEYYIDYKCQKQAKIIQDFELQQPITLQEGFRDQTGKWIRPIVYIVDFIVYSDNKTTFVDVKGFQTETFRMKWKMLQYKYRNEKGYDFLIAK